MPASYEPWAPGVPRVPPGILETSQDPPGDPLGTDQGPIWIPLWLIFLVDKQAFAEFVGFHKIAGISSDFIDFNRFHQI